VVAAATVGIIALGGLALAWWPEDPVGRTQHAAMSDPRTDPEGHAAQARAAEVRARFDQGALMLHAKQYEHAAAALHRVLELAPGMPEAHVNMGYAMLGLQRYAAARDFFESATSLRPRQANAYYGLAIALEALDDLPAALGAMRAYIHLTPSDDAFVRKARSALWEWEARRDAARTGRQERN